MSRFLMVDIGAGTMDVLYCDTRSDLHYKAVVKSPVRCVAEKAAGLKGNLLVDGGEMGGGQITGILKERAKTNEVLLTASAAATLHHDAGRVKSWGIHIITDAEFDNLKGDENYSHLRLADLEVRRLEEIVSGFDVPFAFDALAVCVQDHGAAPSGVSHLDFRHNLFKARLEAYPYPHTLLYKSDEVPDVMNRLTSVVRDAARIPADEVYVMDSGMAAILGASMDVLAGDEKKVLVLDVATSHTVGAAMDGDEIAGFFEYHTVDVTLERLEALLQSLCEGKLGHEQILAEGGHGAFVRKAIGFQAIKTIIATGPKRRLVRESKLPMVFGAPFGDNMMTGTVGLLEALRRRKGLAPIVYV